MKAVVVGMRGAAGVAAEESAGADAIIDLSMDDLRDGLRNCVREITDGHGVDLVADPVGGKANATALRAHGNHRFRIWHYSDNQGELPAGEKHIDVRSSVVGLP